MMATTRPGPGVTRCAATMYMHASSGTFCGARQPPRESLGAAPDDRGRGQAAFRFMYKERPCWVDYCRGDSRTFGHYNVSRPFTCCVWCNDLRRPARDPVTSTMGDVPGWRRNHRPSQRLPQHRERFRQRKNRERDMGEGDGQGCHGP